MSGLHSNIQLSVNLNIRLDVEEHKKGDSTIYLVYIATWMNYKSVGDSFDEAIEGLKKQLEKVEDSLWLAV